MSRFPSVAYVQERLSYRDGRLHWLTRPMSHFHDERTWRMWNTRYAGKEAGSLNSNNRWVVVLDGSLYRRYQLVWMLVKLEQPPIIDHKNRLASDDRIVNLRAVTPTLNRGNSGRQKNNSSGLKGVSWNKAKQKWEASVKSRGRRYFLGRYNDKESAHHAYAAKAEELFGTFACNG